MTVLKRDKIDFKEFLSILLILLGFELSDMTPMIFFKRTQFSTWMVPLIASTIISIPYFFLLSLLNKYKTENLMEIIRSLVGKYMGFLIGIFLFLFSLMAGALRSRNYVHTIHSLFLSNTPMPIIFTFIFIGVWFIASRGFETIGRLAWFIILFSKLGLVLVILLSWKNMDLSMIFPLWGPGKLEIIRQSFHYSGFLVELIFLGMIYPFVKSYKIFKKASLLSIVITALEVTIFFLVYIVVFDYPTITMIAFPFQQLTMLIETDRFLVNLEMIFLLFWIASSMIRYSFFIYLTTATLGHTLNLKEFEPLLIPITALYIMVGLIPRNTVESVYALKSIAISSDLWIVFLLLPIILWVISKVRGGVSN
ncbi:GerAB/ArcD/ProY family transporter [Dethiothermospora halolimnae]|uniref:GerAB/ArcD/ProY family transporter n=1 Tax=Dethiothermospora halolimnae TaxID=3114390 RepID=UPI003CCC178B